MADSATNKNSIKTFITLAQTYVYVNFGING